jgi:hypothetical protein
MSADRLWLLLLTVSIASLVANADTVALSENITTDCFLSMGDWGFDNVHVQHLALRMENMTANPELFGCRSVAFLLALGDNFYETGVRNTSDPQWETTYRRQFRNASQTPALAALPFYVIAGNHDYGRDDPVVYPEYVQAQIDYSAIDPLWRFPATNYTINMTLSGVRAHFVMMNTEPMHLCADGKDLCFQKDEPAWVDQTLAAVDDDASVEFIAAIGHHNLFSPIGGHVDHPYDALLSPILERHRVSFTLFGHSHFAAWGKNPAVTNSSDETPFPGSLWYITNGAARGSDFNNCSWANDTPLLETYCAPPTDNQEGAFMLHRVVVVKNNNASAPVAASASSSSFVEHCLYGSESGSKISCVETPLRSKLHRSTHSPPSPTPLELPPSRLLSNTQIGGIAAAGFVALLTATVVIATRIRRSRQRVQRRGGLEAQNVCGTSVDVGLTETQQHSSFGTSAEA